MDELSQMLSQIMGDPEKVKQIQAMASSLGIGSQSAEEPAVPGHSPASGTDTPETTASEEEAAPPPAAPSGGSPDLSALAGLLGGGNGGTPDLSSLSGLLAGLTGSGAGGGQQVAAGGGFDVGALAGLLRAGNPAPAAERPAAGGFDAGTLLGLSQAFANVQQNKSNIELLLALKPRLSEARARKVDDAIRVMQLIQFLPLIKQTGLFGEMDSLLGGLGGGFGSVLGGIGSSVGGLLGSLTGRGRR